MSFRAIEETITEGLQIIDKYRQRFDAGEQRGQFAPSIHQELQPLYAQLYRQVAICKRVAKEHPFATIAKQADALDETEKLFEAFRYWTPARDGTTGGLEDSTAASFSDLCFRTDKVARSLLKLADILDKPLTDSAADKARIDRYGNGTDSPMSEPLQEEHQIPPDPELIRQYLPSAALAAQAIRELDRICRLYPDAMSEADAQTFHTKLIERFEFYLQMTGLPEFEKIYQRPEFGNASIEQMMSGVFSALLFHHPAITNLASDENDVAEQVANADQACRKQAASDVQQLAGRLEAVMRFDCRFPNPKEDPSFREPRRFLQMLGEYWQPCRAIFLTETKTGAFVGFRPHPLLQFIVELRHRIFHCCGKLPEHEEATTIKDVSTTLFDTILEGEVDDLSCAEEWTIQQLQKIDLAIQCLRLKFSGLPYVLTREEEGFLGYVRTQNASYKRELDKAKSAMFRNNQPPPPAQEAVYPSPPPEAFDQYVTLDQAASLVNKSKKTLERYLNDRDYAHFGMPKPDVEGGGGKAHEWLWSKLRPWLEQQFNRRLPERFPQL